MIRQDRGGQSSVNYATSKETSCSSLLYFLRLSLWAQWSPPQPLQWYPPAQSWPAAVGSPPPGELPAGCWSGIHALAATGSAPTPGDLSPASVPRAPARSTKDQQKGGHLGSGSRRRGFIQRSSKRHMLTWLNYRDERALHLTPHCVGLHLDSLCCVLCYWI